MRLGRVHNAAMPNMPKRLLLASIHDVAPRFEREVDLLAAEIEPFVGSRFAMLVVPNHWGTGPIVAGSPFAARLRSWADSGVEMLLHGFYHRDTHRHRGLDSLRARFLTAREGEFLALSKAEAAERIAEGRALIEDITGRPVAGFVAPAWLYGPGAGTALAEAGFDIAEDHWRVWSPVTGRRLASGPVITWASRTPARLASSIAAAAVLGRVAPQQALRIAVHPGDCSSPALLASIRSTFARASRNRVAAHYSELS
jgi:predicted deacetylase